MTRWLWVALLLHAALLIPWLTWPDNDGTSAPVVHTQLNVQPPSESASAPISAPASTLAPAATNAEPRVSTQDTAQAVVNTASSAAKRVLSGAEHQQHTPQQANSHQATNHQSRSQQSTNQQSRKHQTKTNVVRRTPKPKTERSARPSTTAQSQPESTLVLSGQANNRYEQRLLDHLKASVPVLKGVSGQVHIEMTISYGQIITQIRVLSVRAAPNAEAMIRRWVVPAVLKANPLPAKPSDYDEPYRFRPVLVLP